MCALISSSSSSSSSNVLQMRCLIKPCISKYSAIAAFHCTVVDKNIYTDYSVAC